MQHPKSHRFSSFLLLLTACIFWQACTDDTADIPDFAYTQTPYELNLAPHFPALPIPEDNALTQERVHLGKKLFYDPILSRDSTISCSSCHLQNIAFTDAEAISIGIENRLGFRNTPSLANIAYHDALFKEGGVPSLELQVVAPIQEHAEMDFNFNDIITRLINHPEYPTDIYRAYGREPDPFSITRSIAAFERTLISDSSPYDGFLQGDSSMLSLQEKRGLSLFNSPNLACSSCHAGFDLTNLEFLNNGLYEIFEDPGRYRITLDDADRGKFKVPSLRNIALTAPYMHNGSLASLDEVLDHYQSGGTGHPNQSSLISGFDLSAEEREDLKAFLHALTDSVFIQNPAFNME